MHDDGVQDRPDRDDRPLRRDRDDLDRDDFVRDTPFPGKIRAAGIIWIVFGGLLLVNAMVALIAGFLLSSATGAAAIAGLGVCAALLPALFGAAFLFVGVQSVRGTAADTLGNGIGSIIIGALVLAFALFALFVDPISAGINLLSAGGLITAGVLALIARSEYAMWKRGQPRRY